MRSNTRRITLTTCNELLIDGVMINLHFEYATNARAQILVLVLSK